MSYNEEFVDISSSSQVQKVYGKPPRKVKKGRGLRVFVLALSILMLLSGSGVVYYYHVIDSLNYDNLGDTTSTNENGEVETTVSLDTSGASSLLSSSNVLNILLFGQDAGATADSFGRSDTMILLSIDNVHQKLKLTSFQRDTYVTIPGYGDNKINSAFSTGGVKLSIATIEANFGIKVDKYAVVDFKSFRSVINALDGIDIELSVDEIEYINAQIDVNNQLGKTQFLEYDPYADGDQLIHLDGYQALWYARDRGEENLGGNPNYSFSGDDWDRTSRQRKLITTVVKSLREEASLTDLVQIVNDVGPLVTTNLKKSDITFLVSNMMTYIGYEMEEISLPTEGNWRYGRTDDGQSVIVITDWDQVRYDLASFIYEDAVSGGSAASY